MNKKSIINNRSNILYSINSLHIINISRYFSKRPCKPCILFLGINIPQKESLISYI